MKKLYFIISVLMVMVGQLYAQNNSGWQWTSISGTTTNNAAKMVNDIATDASGNVYTTGAFAGTLTLGATTVATSGDGVSGSFDQDAFIAKYDAAGNVQWLQRFGLTSAGSNQIGRVITVDGSGNVYVGGSGMSIYTTNSAFLNKYDSNGNLLWSKTDFPLYEVCALAIADDGNIIVHETGSNAKNIYKISSADKSVIWTSAVTNIGSNSGTTYKDFTDSEGNIYFSCFLALNGGSTVTVLGENYTTASGSMADVTSFIVSLDKNGNKRWVQQLNQIQAVWFTVDANGNVYIPFGGGFGGTFQGISTASPLGDRYFVLDKNGTVIRHQLGMPYKGQFRVKADGIYGYEKFQFTTTAAGTVKYGDYYFRTNTSTPTKAYGIVIKYDKTTDQPLWANSFEMTGLSNNSGSFNVLEIGNLGKIMVGGTMFTAIKTNSNTYTSTAGSGYNQTDFFVAQFNGNNIAAPAVTTWNGNAANSSWTDAANWDNGAPTGNEKTIIPAGMGTYPTGITAANVTGRIEIANGINIGLPMGFVAPGGILNNGNLTVAGSDTFASGFNSGASPLTGTGKMIFTTGSPTGMANFAFPGDLEINQPGVNVSVLNVSVAGNLYITAGRLAVDVLTLTNPNATVTGSATGFVYYGTLKRAVNANGTYNFPVGIIIGSSVNTYMPVSLTLNNIAGPSYISVYADLTQSNSGGTEPNINIGANTINTLLNKNIWKISADAAITSGSYNVNLTATSYTNGVTDAARFVGIRRDYRASVWTYEGTNGTSTQTGETVNSGVTSNGIINVYNSGLSSFGEFGVGIATSAVAVGTTTGTTTWTGNAGDKTWATAANWDNGTPDGLKDAIIPSGMVTYPETFTAADNAKSLTINNGASIKLPMTLKVSGTITNNGSITLNGNTGDYFKGFRTSTSASPAILKGNGKLVFTNIGPKGTALDTVLLVNNLEIDRTADFKISNKTSGNVNILNGVMIYGNIDGVSALLTMTNPSASLSNNAPSSYIQSHISRAVSATGTYNYPVGIEKYMPLVITTNNLAGTTAYDVGVESAPPQPKTIVDGYPITTFLDMGSSVYRAWYVTPTGVATGGSISLNFEARGYTNGVADVSRYVLLRRQDVNYAWQNVSDAVITENAGIISISVANLSPIVTKAEFAIGIKGTVVTWNGSVSNVYSNANNWTPATVPTTANKVIFNAGATNYPASYNASGMVQIGAGTTLSLPSNVDFGAGIENNGVINLTSTGAFAGFNNGNTPVSGTGKLVFGASGPTSISAAQIGNGIEINRSSGIAISKALTVDGSITMTSGILSGNYALTMSNPNATVTYSPTSYIATSSFVRAVNTSGTYAFPIGTTARYAPATLTLNSVAGPTKITSSYVTASTGSIYINTTVDGKSIGRILDAGTWTLTPDVALTSGTYNVTLEGRGYTNGSITAANYVVLKRQNSGYSYQFLGTNVTSTETGGVVTAGANGINGFSDFAIGVASNYETKWTGAAGDKKWATVGNWSDGVPSSLQKAVFDALSVNLPTNFDNATYKTIDKLEVADGLTVNVSSTLTVTNGIINNGTIIPNGSSWTSSPWAVSGSGTIAFTSVSPSYVTLPSTATTFNNNIEADKTGLGISGNFYGNLNLKSGVLGTNSNTLTMDKPDAVITQTSAANYINGTLKRKVSSSGNYNFPIGTASSNAPISFNLNSITGTTYIQAQFANASVNPPSPIAVGATQVSTNLNGGYWSVQPDVALTAGSYSVTYGMNTYTNGVTDANRYVPVKSSGGTWSYAGPHGTSTQTGGTENSGVVSNGTVQVIANNQTTLSTFLLLVGIADEGTLPVKLIDFTAKAQNNSVLLNWKTANEVNSKGFEIYRSGDDGVFVKIATVETDNTPSTSVKTDNNLSLRTYTDKQPLKGNNYYKLVQIDNDGKETELGIQKVTFRLQPSNLPALYPNPATNYFSVAGNQSAVSKVTLTDLSGRTVLTIVNPTEKIALPNLANGIYIANISYLDGTSSKHKLRITQ